MEQRWTDFSEKKSNAKTTEGCKLDHRNRKKRVEESRLIKGSRRIFWVKFVFFHERGRFEECDGVNIFRYLGKVRERDLAASRSPRL